MKKELISKPSLFAFSLAFLLLIIWLGYFLFIPMVTEYYWLQVEKPRQVKDYGFQLTEQRVYLPVNTPSQMKAQFFLCIKSVTPGGRFDKAGFRENDILLPAGFYSSDIELALIKRIHSGEKYGFKPKFVVLNMRDLMKTLQLESNENIRVLWVEPKR